MRNGRAWSPAFLSGSRLNKNNCLFAVTLPTHPKSNSKYFIGIFSFSLILTRKFTENEAVFPTYLPTLKMQVSVTANKQSSRLISALPFSQAYLRHFQVVTKYTSGLSSQQLFLQN
jgi:hypothetical protein